MKRYRIKEGNHSSGWHFGLTFKNKISFKAKFDKSCLYDLRNINNYDINKLFGFSTTYNHHTQSARVGWRRKDDGQSIEILTYTYDGGVRIDETVLGVVKPDQEFTCSIEDIETDYVYTFTCNEYTMTVRDSKDHDKVWFKYVLYPYFGGNQTAPHDMTIYVSRL